MKTPGFLYGFPDAHFFYIIILSHIEYQSIKLLVFLSFIDTADITMTRSNYLHKMFSSL